MRVKGGGKLSDTRRVWRKPRLTIYTGYSVEALIGRKESNVDYILTHTDLLIDGPYIREFAKNTGEYRGPRNQRLIQEARSLFLDFDSYLA
ncbi:MAG: 4Fe-4S cluster-binding domain-containing protein [Pyrinomonadaceae bacterium]